MNKDTVKFTLMGFIRRRLISKGKYKDDKIVEDIYNSLTEYGIALDDKSLTDPFLIEKLNKKLFESIARIR